MKLRKPLLFSYKVFFALLGLSSIIIEIAVLMGRGVFNPVNFFSFFTIETNCLVVITLLLSALALAVGKQTKLDVLRAATTVYILVVGIGFSFLLSGLEDVALTAVPWDNVVLHYIMPAAVLVDFLIDPPKRTLNFKTSLFWLFFPALYAAYSLVRGVLIGWYPYPFLNPATNGPGAVALTITGLFVLGLVLIWGVCRYTALRKKS